MLNKLEVKTIEKEKKLVCSNIKGKKNRHIFVCTFYIQWIHSKKKQDMFLLMNVEKRKNFLVV